MKAFDYPFLKYVVMARFKDSMTNNINTSSREDAMTAKVLFRRCKGYFLTSPKYFFVLFLILSASILSAQTFTAEVNANPVGVGEVFQISFTFSGGGSGNPAGFQPPSFKDFRVAAGPFQSQSFNFINGRSSSSQSYAYNLVAQAKGKFTIGSAAISYGGKVLKTQPLVIEVTAHTGGGGNQSSGQTGSQSGGSQQVSSTQIGENLFIKAIADKNTAYTGEQVTVTYKLYTRLQIAQPQISKLPGYQGFWAEEIETPNTLNLSRETFNGKVYNTAVLKKVALFPSQAGKFDITPFKLKLKVVLEKRRKSQGFFDDFFNDPFSQQQEVIEYEAVSNTVNIQSLKIPDNNKPANYSNAVGSYKMDVTIDKQKVKQHDPVTLKISMSGTGNIQMLESPNLNLPAQFDKFDPKTNVDITRNGIIGGKKTFEYLIVPRAEGKVEIPALSFSFFNPAKKSFETLTSQPYSVEIERGEGQFANSNPNISKEDVKLLGQDIRYIKTTEPNLQPIGSYLILKPLTWILFTLPILGVFGLFLFKKREEKLLSNVSLSRNRKAEKLAKGRLKTAAKTLKARDNEAFYLSVSSALFGYVEDKFSIPKSDLSYNTIIEKLEQNNFPAELSTRLKAALEECEFARFAPASDRDKKMELLYSSAIAIIVDIEAHIQSGKK